MAKSGRKFSIAKVVKVGTEYALLNVTNQVINTIPNIPPAVKALAGVSTSFATFEILKGVTDTLPPQMKGIANALIEVQSALLVVQQIPNLISTFSGSGFGAQATVP